MSRRYWSKNMQTSPHMSYNGLSEPTPQSPLPAEAQPQSSHVPLSFILAERGTDRPVFTTSENAWTLFGKKTFLKNVPWNIHQNDYLTHVLKSGGQAIVKRIILPDAKKARIRVALETSFTLIPIYKYHEDWSLVKQYNALTGQWNNVELGQRKGLKVTPRIYAIPYSENQSFGQGTVITEQSSRTYPIFDLELRDSGEFGNSITMTLANVVRDLTDVTDPRDFIARANIAFNENTTDVILNKQGEATTSFTLSGNVIDPLTAVKQHLSSAVNNFDGLIGRAHVYQSNIEKVLDQLIHGSEVDPTYLGEKALIEEAILLNTDVDLTYPHAADLDVDLNRYYFDILTGKNNKGKFFINGDYPSLEQSSDLEFTEGEAVSFLGGSDGFPLDSNGEVDRLKLLQLYDESVRIELNKFANPGHMYQDLAKNPYTVWYDSGYSMPTKTAAFNINRYRPEITLILAAFSYADYTESGLTISCEGAVSGTGCIEFSGTWNIEIDGEEVATNLTAAQIKDYLNGTGEFNVFECVDEVPVDPEPDPTPISCEGAADYVTLSGLPATGGWSGLSVSVIQNSVIVGTVQTGSAGATGQNANIISTYLTQYGIESFIKGTFHNTTDEEIHLLISGGEGWVVEDNPAHAITAFGLEICLAPATEPEVELNGWDKLTLTTYPDQYSQDTYPHINSDTEWLTEDYDVFINDVQQSILPSYLNISQLMRAENSGGYMMYSQIPCQLYNFSDQILRIKLVPKIIVAQEPWLHARLRTVNRPGWGDNYFNDNGQDGFEFDLYPFQEPYAPLSLTYINFATNLSRLSDFCAVNPASGICPVNRSPGDNVAEFTFNYSINGEMYVFTKTWDWYFTNVNDVMKSFWDELSSNPKMYKNGKPAFKPNFTGGVKNELESIYGYTDPSGYTMPVEDATTLIIYANENDPQAQESGITTKIFDALVGFGQYDWLRIVSYGHFED